MDQEYLVRPEPQGLHRGPLRVPRAPRGPPVQVQPEKPELPVQRVLLERLLEPLVLGPLRERLVRLQCHSFVVLFPIDIHVCMRNSFIDKSDDIVPNATSSL